MTMDKEATSISATNTKAFQYQDKSEAIHKGALGHDVALLVAAFIKTEAITTATEAVDSYIKMKKDIYEKDKEV